MMMASRVLGGFGSGIIFIVVPTYMSELLSFKYSCNVIADILITQFGLGICIQYFMGEFNGKIYLNLENNACFVLQ